jgi:hypothetical protein
MVRHISRLTKKCPVIISKTIWSISADPKKKGKKDKRQQPPPTHTFDNM